MKTLLRLLVSAAAYSVSLVSVTWAALPASPVSTPAVTSFPKVEISAPTVNLNNDKPAPATPKSEQSIRVTPLSQSGALAQSASANPAKDDSAINLPKVTIFADNPSFDDTDLLTAKGQAELARKLYPTMAFQGQRPSVSLALFQFGEDQRKAHLDHDQLMAFASAQEKPDDKLEQKRTQNEIYDTYLRQRNATTEFLDEFYARAR